MYDREDDYRICAELARTEVKNRITLEIFAEIDIASGRFVTSELLRTG